MISIKRIYDPPAKTDGARILVDRLWPRGMSKERAHIDLWLKEIAPSTELRTWFGHAPEKFEEFSQRYAEELHGNPAAQRLRMIVKQNQDTTLLYAAKDPVNNNAVVLQQFLASNS